MKKILYIIMMALLIVSWVYIAGKMPAPSYTQEFVQQESRESRDFQRDLEDLRSDLRAEFHYYRLQDNNIRR